MMKSVKYVLLAFFMMLGDAKPIAAIHGMVLFGQEGNEFFASHIPMFMLPHDWQALFKVKITASEKNTQEALDNLAQHVTPQTLYTIEPKPFVLPDLLSSKIHHFRADFFKGNFEQGGQLLFANVTVTLIAILDNTHLDALNAPNAHLTYIYLNNTHQSFLIHQISAPDNFDQIVEIKWLKPRIKLKIFTFDASDNLNNALQQGQYFMLKPDGLLIQTRDRSKADFEVIHAFYCTLGPDFTKRCPD